MKRPAEAIDEPPFKRIKDAIVWTEPTTLPRLEFSDKMVRLSREFMHGSGLEVPVDRDELILFRREGVDLLWGEIQRSAINSKALLIIHGPPGSGKSVASYTFAAGLIEFSEWNVMWVRHVEEEEHYHVVRVQDGKKSMCQILVSSMNHLIDIVLDSLDSPSRKSTIFLDGYVNDSSMEYIVRICREWRASDQERRCLVVVTSMVKALKQFRVENTKTLATSLPRLRLQVGKVAPTTTSSCSTNGSPSYLISWVETDRSDDMESRMRFQLFSWTLAEYEEAVKDAIFFWSAAKALGSEVFTIQQAMGTDFNSRESAVRNKYDVAGGSARYMFACSIDKAIRSITDALLTVQNYRDLLEEWLERHQKGPSIGFRPHENNEIELRHFHWLVPTRWNQSGYDVLRFDAYDRDEWDDELKIIKRVTRERVCFLQLTRYSTHDSIAEPFLRMLHHLKALKVPVGMVEVWFVVPECKLKEFRPLKNKLWFEKEVVVVSFPHARMRHTIDEAQQGTNSSSALLLPESVEVRIHVVGVKYPIVDRKNEAGTSASTPVVAAWMRELLPCV